MSTESTCSPVDPRVQVELEKLNTATDNINKYEVELDEAKCEFKRVLAESAVRIKQAAHKLGNSIDAARPYYESRIYAAQLTKETHQAAANYEKAKSVHATAKEMVYLAEQGLGEKSTLDTACQEMLSHAASKVNQSQLEVTDSRNSLKMCQLKLEVANNRVGKMQSQLKQAIKASSFSIRRNLLLLNALAFQHDFGQPPYYETRANFNGVLKAQKERISDLEGRVSDAKMTYNEALKNLEQISEEIHRQRQQQRNLLNSEAISTPSSSDGTTTEARLSSNFPCDIDSTDEYRPVPDHLSKSAASPVSQRHQDEHDSPHLLRDFDAVLTFPPQMHKSASAGATAASCESEAFAQAQLHGPYELRGGGCSAGEGSGGSGNTTSNVSSSTGGGGGCGGGGLNQDDNDIEQWTEIRLSHSESTSSSYSNQSLLHDQQSTAGGSGSGSGGGRGLGGAGDDAHSQNSSSSSSDEPRRKVTCTIFHDEQLQKKQGLSHWLSRSNSFKTAGRRQSLDLLIDAGDKVKDVFSFGFQKVGKTLERRNSESEMNSEGGAAGGAGGGGGGGGGGGVGNSGGSSGGGGTTDFFLFSRSSDPKELLSDEQVENLLLQHSVDEHGVIIVEELKSPPAAAQAIAVTPTGTTTARGLPPTSHMSQLATLLF